MCAGAGVIVGLLSSAVSAVGAIQQANAQADAANHQAAVARRNAKLEEVKARDAIVRGGDEIRKNQRRTNELLGTQRAAMAANGLDVTYGSPLDAAVDTAMLGELDEITLNANRHNEAYDHKITAWNYKNEAELKSAEARNAKSAGAINAFGSLLTGIGKAYGGYAKSTSFG